MKYDIYFHNDFDGRASAAVMLAFLRSRGDEAEHYVPIDHDLAPQWIDEHFFKKHHLFRGKRNPAIVVDFPYHPAAAFWFDHHPTAFKKSQWQKDFRADREHQWDASYPSCCHLVLASLKKNFGWKPPAHIAELAKWLDIIDGARYSSAKQTIVMKEPALQVDAFIESVYHDKKVAAEMVDLLSRKSLAEIARITKVKRVAHSVRERAKANLAFYKKNVKVEGVVSIIDLSKHPEAMLRYAPYYLFPKLPYGIRFGMKNGEYHLGIGANPWLVRKNKIHIGNLLREHYHGGGHRDAGGVEFATRKEVDKALPQIVAILNNKK
jgi:oligoribonuclease NrnB/cAMP/cGMP phosphodiesterase (DHH superfamily)